MDENMSDLEKELYPEEVSEGDNQRFLDKITDWYFRPKPFEKWEDGKVYQSIGIKYHDILHTLKCVVS